MKLVKTVCVILLGCLLMAGCTYKNKTLDPQARAVIEALNDEDPEAFTDLILEKYQEGGPEGFESIKEHWIDTDPDEAKLVSLNINTKINPVDGTVKTYTGVYQLPREDELDNLKIVYVESKEDSGLSSVLLGSYVDKNTSHVAVFNVASALVYLIAATVTIVDIVRKKPGYWGILIVVALLAFTLKIMSVSISVPVGSIVYWCIRRSLLEKKAAKEEDYQ